MGHTNGVPVLHSRDLVHWERIGNCVERLPFDRYAEPAHGCGPWAPALRWHDGRFYAFIPLPDEASSTPPPQIPAARGASCIV